MALPENTIMEVKIGYTVNDQQCWNVLHYVADGTYPGVSPFDISTALLDNLDNQLGTAGTLLNTMRIMWGTNVTLNLLTVQPIFPLRYRLVKGEYTSAGLGDGVCNAQNLAGYIEKFGELAGRNRMGSFHLGGLLEGSYDAGEISPGFFANLQTIAERIKEPIEFTSGGVDYDYTPVILNKSPIPDSNPVRYAISGFTEIFDTSAFITLRTQRTRTKGYGI